MHTPISPKIILSLTGLLLAACASSTPEAPPATAVPAAASEPTQAAVQTVTEAVASPAEASASGFSLTSPVMDDGGALPQTYTCDGDSLSPPLAWSGAPEGTVGYALAMHHVPGPGDTHWYWVVYNIPAEVQSIEAGQSDFGSFGTNSVNDQRVYAPPCSQGPGEKLYTLSVYALSAAPELPNPASVDRDTLLTAIEDITLASASIDVTYER